MSDIDYFEEYKKSPFYKTYDKTTDFNEYELRFLKLAIHTVSQYAKENWHEPNLKRLSSRFVRKASAVILIDTPKPVEYFDDNEFLTWQDWQRWRRLVEDGDKKHFSICAAISRLLEGGYRIVSAETLEIKLSELDLN